VKLAIPLGAILLVGIAVALHRLPQPDQGGVPAGAAAPVREERQAEPVVQLPQPSFRSLSEALAPQRPQAALGSGPAPVSSWRKLSGPLERGLNLTEIQLRAVDAILRSRENEIRECHEGIRKSGVLDMRHYEWQVGQMKASWYRRIDALLDSAQHHRFVALVEEGLFNEGLAFTHEPGMTVLE